MTQHRVTRRKLVRHGVKLLKLARGTFVARWFDPLGGQQRQVNLDRLGLTTDAARQAWAATKAKSLAGMRAAVASGVVEARRIGLAAAVDAYLARFGHAPTVRAKRYVLDAMTVWLRDNAAVGEASQITPIAVVRWRDAVLAPSEDGRAASTRNRWLLCCGAFLRWLIEQGMAPLLNRDAVAAGTKRARQPAHAITFLRPEQVKALLTAAIAHDRAADDVPVSAFVLGLLTTGVRFEELRGLQWSDVDLPGGCINIRAAAAKTRQARRITFAETPSLAKLLAVLALRRGQDELVFGIRNHGEWDRLRKRLAAVYGGPPATAHTIRRTTGTVLTCAPSVFGAASSFLTARRLGHSVVVAERLYAGVLTGLPASAKTLEACCGVESEAATIVAMAGGVVAPAGETEAATG